MLQRVASVPLKWSAVDRGGGRFAAGVTLGGTGGRGDTALALYLHRFFLENFLCRLNIDNLPRAEWRICAENTAMQNYSTEEINIAFSDLQSLRITGRMNLGINREVAREMFQRGYGPTKTAADLAAHVFNWLGLLALAVSVYFSFTYKWWIFIVGFALWRMIWSAVKSATPDNYLDSAFIDEDFYDRGCKVGLWYYQMKPEDAEAYANG